MTITMRPHSANKPIKTTYFHLTWIGLYLVVALWFRALCFGGLCLMWRKLWWGLCCTPRSIPCPRWLSPGTPQASKPCSLISCVTGQVSPGRYKLFLESTLAQYNLFLLEPAWLKSGELYNVNEQWTYSSNICFTIAERYCRLPCNYSHFDPGSASPGYCRHKLGWVTILAKRRWPRRRRPVLT